jgi:hypothetical protein
MRGRGPGGRGGRDGGRGGGRGFGGRGGGRGGGGGYGYDQGPPDSVTEAGTFSHPCEGEAVCKLTNEKARGGGARAARCGRWHALEADASARQPRLLAAARARRAGSGQRAPARPWPSQAGGPLPMARRAPTP